MKRRPCSASACLGEIQTEFDRLPPVVDERLVGGGERQEEMGVEALGQEIRGDPVGERRQRVERRRKPLPSHELGEGRGAIERGRPRGRDEPLLALGSRQQHPAFLERLADRRDLEGRERVGL